MSNLSYFLLLVATVLIVIEIAHFLKPSSPLCLKPLEWETERSENKVAIKGLVEISNPNSKMEVMIPEFSVNTILLGELDFKEIEVNSEVSPIHPDQETRKDGYWVAYILKSKKKTKVQVKITLSENSSKNLLHEIENIWIDFSWINYGPFGRLKKQQGLLVPIKRPTLIESSKAIFEERCGHRVLPIKTHLLGSLDNTIQVIHHYAKHLIQPGDLLTIGETPLAIMQGRYIHPSNINISLVARLLCKSFHPTSSLATACGMQALIDLVGPTRVIFAWLIGALLKLTRIKGGFYRLAGNQARLIDDITGTTPPYDQTIVLGPTSTRKLCEEVATSLGIGVAIVDVNDLGRVKVLATSPNCNKTIIRQALLTNPAGNADEQTPLVLIRPS